MYKGLGKGQLASDHIIFILNNFIFVFSNSKKEKYAAMATTIHTATNE